ncbi:MAG: nucleoside-diphosphate sugar epimerase [Alphaproteobacteria bacterium]|nr:nucleoside-diphosphate sugar epimerase [Alphaproteobacteria bacterium]
MAKDTRKNIWVLVDDRAGNTNQAIGVAEALGELYSLKNICYTPRADWPNSIRGNSLLGVDRKRTDRFSPPWPDLVIAAGRKLAPVARHIKKKSGGKAKLVHIMWPGRPAGGFDLIALPQHDKRHLHSRIFRTLGAPGRVTPGVLAQAATLWQKTLEQSAPPGPYISVLLGGNTKDGEYTQQHAYEVGRMASTAANALGGALLVTSSRRTEEGFKRAFFNALNAPYFYYDPEKDHANPYHAFLALSEAIIVTGDSISMCSESCSSGKPVYIYAPEGIIPPKHRLFHAQLYKEGYARPLTMEQLRQLERFSPPPQPLQAAHDIALNIKALFF